jgi:ATP-dependent helicase HrpB
MTQRAGRAGREAPGKCLRLCSAAEFQARARFDEPELQRADLTGALLQSLAAGFGDLGALPWLEAPPAAHLDAAWIVLEELNAVDAEKKLTPKGAALARAPLHPRLASLAWEARAGSSKEWDDLMACLGLLNEGRLRELDFFTAIQRYEPMGPARQLFKQLSDWLEREKERPAATQGPWLERLAFALMQSFPEQLAFSRHGTDKRGEAKFVLAGGSEAMLRSDSFGVKPGLYFIAEVLETRALGLAAGMPRVQSLFPILPDWILAALPNRVKEEPVLAWDANAKRVSLRERLAYGVLSLDEGEAHSAAAKAAGAELLLKEAKKAGLGAFCGEGQPDKYLSRRAFILQGKPNLDLPGEDELWGVVEQLARDGALSFEALRSADPLRLLLDQRPEVRKTLEAETPAKLRLPSGRETSIHYEAGKPPWVASRLQDFFGQRETPVVAGQRCTVHLLAPNQRPQQVTQDLAGFWEREYPRLRKELMRKYPRHAWPEDPYDPKGAKS